jgi:hypothetical protein
MNYRFKRHWARDFGYNSASRLFGGLECDSLPARHSFGCVRSVAQADVRQFGDNRHYARDTQLSCLLYNQIKLLAFEQSDRKR